MSSIEKFAPLNEGPIAQKQISIILCQAKLSSKKVVLWLDKGSNSFPFFLPKI